MIFLDVFKNNTSKLKLLIYFNISLESALKLTSGFLREQKQSAGEEERNPSLRKTTLSFNIVNVKESTPVENRDTEKSIRKLITGVRFRITSKETRKKQEILSSFCTQNVTLTVQVILSAANIRSERPSFL